MNDCNRKKKNEGRSGGAICDFTERGLTLRQPPLYA